MVVSAIIAQSCFPTVIMHPFVMPKKNNDKSCRCFTLSIRSLHDSYTEAWIIC